MNACCSFIIYLWRLSNIAYFSWDVVLELLLTELVVCGIVLASLAMSLQNEGHLLSLIKGCA